MNIHVPWGSTGIYEIVRVYLGVYRDCEMYVPRGSTSMRLRPRTSGQ